MPYVQRDEAGTIVGQFANFQPGRAEEWVEDGAAELSAVEHEEVSATARRWRNSRIAKTDYLAMPDYPLSESERAELAGYRMALRDWPQSQGFPVADAPEAPVWVEERLLDI